MNKFQIGETVRLVEPYRCWSVGEITDYNGSDGYEVTLTNGKELYLTESEIEEY